MNTYVIPDHLEKNDKIALICPASPPDAGQLCSAVHSIHHLELVPVLYPSCTQTDFTLPYLAGTEKQRAMELTSAFADNEIKAIIALRGGYGSARIADLLDYSVISENPKIFAGSSDITFLHAAIMKHTNMITLHSPMPLSGYHQHDDGLTVDSLKRSLFNTSDIYSEFQLNSTESSYNSCNFIRKGSASGRIFAGNLSVLCTLSGTAYQPDMSGRIIFIEEIDEQLYKIDRMLNLLFMCGFFNNCEALIFGYFTDCCRNSEEKEILGLIFTELAEKLQCPVVWNFPFGHEYPAATLPQNGYARIDGETVVISVDRA